MSQKMVEFEVFLFKKIHIFIWIVKVSEVFQMMIEIVVFFCVQAICKYIYLFEWSRKVKSLKIWFRFSGFMFKQYVNTPIYLDFQDK